MAEPDWDLVRRRLTTFVRRRLREPADAEDIVQTALMRAVAARQRQRGPDRLEAWLYRVARNAVIDHARRRQTARRLDAELPLFPETPDGAALGDLAGCVDAMLRGLPDQDREALDLMDRQGLRQAEAARRLGLSLSGAKSRVQRARARLRRSLEACCAVDRDAGGRVTGFADGAAACPPNPSTSPASAPGRASRPCSGGGG